MGDTRLRQQRRLLVATACVPPLLPLLPLVPPLLPLVATLAADENRASAMAAKQLKLEPPLAASFCKGQFDIAYSFLSR